jgi:hypothetical protein
VRKTSSTAQPSQARAWHGLAATSMRDTQLGGSSLFPGVLVGPPHVRKCHQIMPSKEHIQLGWVVRWVISTPRATPRLGGVCVPCQYLPSSFVLALRELGLRLGVKSQLPLRASSRGAPPGAPNALSVFIPGCLSWLTPARASKTRLGVCSAGGAQCC